MHNRAKSFSLIKRELNENKESAIDLSSMIVEDKEGFFPQKILPKSWLNPRYARQRFIILDDDCFFVVGLLEDSSGFSRASIWNYKKNELLGQVTLATHGIVTAVIKLPNDRLAIGYETDRPYIEIYDVQDLCKITLLTQLNASVSWYENNYSLGHISSMTAKETLLACAGYRKKEGESSGIFFIDIWDTAVIKTPKQRYSYRLDIPYRSDTLDLDCPFLQFSKGKDLLFVSNGMVLNTRAELIKKPSEIYKGIIIELTGNRLALAGDNGTIYICNDTMTCIKELPFNSPCTALYQLRNENLVSGSSNGIVKVYNRELLNTATIKFPKKINSFLETKEGEIIVDCEDGFYSCTTGIRKLNRVEIEELLEVISKNPSITKLNLSGLELEQKDIDDEGYSSSEYGTLHLFLQKNKNITELDLRDTGIDYKYPDSRYDLSRREYDYDHAGFCRMLEKRNSCFGYEKTIHFGWSQSPTKSNLVLGYWNAEHIKSLKKISPINSLKLQNIRLNSEEHFQSIVDLLVSHDELEELDIGDIATTELFIKKLLDTTKRLKPKLTILLFPKREIQSSEEKKEIVPTSTVELASPLPSVGSESKEVLADSPMVFHGSRRQIDRLLHIAETLTPDDVKNLKSHFLSTDFQKIWKRISGFDLDVLSLQIEEKKESMEDQVRIRKIFSNPQQKDYYLTIKIFLRCILTAYMALNSDAIKREPETLSDSLAKAVRSSIKIFVPVAQEAIAEIICQAWDIGNDWAAKKRFYETVRNYMEIEAITGKSAETIANTMALELTFARIEDISKIRGREGMAFIDYAKSFFFNNQIDNPIRLLALSDFQTLQEIFSKERFHTIPNLYELIIKITKKNLVESPGIRPIRTALPTSCPDTHVPTAPADEKKEIVIDYKKRLETVERENAELKMALTEFIKQFKKLKEQTDHDHVAKGSGPMVLAERKSEPTADSTLVVLERRITTSESELKNMTEQISELFDSIGVKKSHHNDSDASSLLRVSLGLSP